jgi:hypothetical protein
VVPLLVDANLDGHAELLAMRLRTEAWLEFLEHLDLRFLHLEDTGLDRASSDAEVWRWCQENGSYLLTANRNLESEDSLEATIRREGTADSLPVLTLSDPDRLFHSPTYLDQVIEKLLEYLLNQERYRGAGRLYLP